MSLQDALRLGRKASVNINPSDILFTRVCQTLNPLTGGMTETSTTFLYSCRIVRPSYIPRPDESIPRPGGTSVDADWLLTFDIFPVDILIGDTFLHPTYGSSCQIIGVEDICAGGEGTSFLALAKEVK